MSGVRFSPTSPSIQLTETAPRATDASAAQRFREGLANSAHIVLGGVEAAASVVPGASVVSAAVRDALGSNATSVGSSTAALTATTGSPESPTASTDAAVSSLGLSGADQNMQFLRMQEQLQSENRRYSALSNAMKARHETAKNSINNIR